MTLPGIGPYQWIDGDHREWQKGQIDHHDGPTLRITREQSGNEFTASYHQKGIQREIDERQLSHYTTHEKNHFAGIVFALESAHAGDHYRAHRLIENVDQRQIDASD